MDITCPQVCRFLYTGPRVVEEEQESAVTQGIASVCRQSRQRPFDLIAFEEDRFRGLGTLSRNGGYLLGLPKSVGESLGNVFEEGAQRRQSLIAGLGRIASTFPQGI